MISRLIIAATDGRVPCGFLRLDGSKCTSTEPVLTADLPHWTRVLESALTQIRLRNAGLAPAPLEAWLDVPPTPATEDGEL